MAADVNLSVSAVSLALRGHPSIPPDTAARIKAAARRLGYEPDPALSALAAYRSGLRVQRDFNVIALVSNWPSAAGWWRSASACQVIEGATVRARELGYSLQTFSAGDPLMTPRRLSEVLQSRGIRGVIVGPLADPAETFEMEWKRFSVVMIERPAQYGHFHHIVPNYYADMMLVQQKLREKGYRRPGLVLAREIAERVGHQWEAAYAVKAASWGKRIPMLVLARDAPSSVILHWYRRHRPDVVVGRGGLITEVLQSAGIAVPAEVGYAGLNVSDDAPGVSGILQHREAMGATAVDILNTLLHRHHRGPNEISLGTHVDGTWHEGETLRSAAG